MINPSFASPAASTVDKATTVMSRIVRDHLRRVGPKKFNDRTAAATTLDYITPTHSNKIAIPLRGQSPGNIGLVNDIKGILGAIKNETIFVGNNTNCISVYKSGEIENLEHPLQRMNLFVLREVASILDHIEKIKSARGNNDLIGLPERSHFMPEINTCGHLNSEYNNADIWHNAPNTDASFDVLSLEDYVRWELTDSFKYWQPDELPIFTPPRWSQAFMNEGTQKRMAIACLRALQDTIATKGATNIGLEDVIEQPELFDDFTQKIIDYTSTPQLWGHTANDLIRSIRVCELTRFEPAEKNDVSLNHVLHPHFNAPTLLALATLNGVLQKIRTDLIPTLDLVEEGTFNGAPFVFSGSNFRSENNFVFIGQAEPKSPGTLRPSYATDRTLIDIGKLDPPPVITPTGDLESLTLRLDSHLYPSLAAGKMTGFTAQHVAGRTYPKTEKVYIDSLKV